MFKDKKSKEDTLLSFFNQENESSCYVTQNILCTRSLKHFRNLKFLSFNTNINEHQSFDYMNSSDEEISPLHVICP
jgi:Zn/Cd-binding protein ZinT